MTSRKKPVRRWLLGDGERIAGIVYGTIVVMAVIAASSKTADTDATRVAGLVVSTTVVFWFAHVYAHALGLSAESRVHLTWQRLRGVAAHEASILRAAVLPTAALLLGALGLIGEPTAAWLAMGLGMALLASQGFAYARIEQLGILGTAVAIIFNLLLGLAVVGLKAFVSH